MKQPYKVQNRTSESRRIKFVKNGGTVSFPKTPTASFVENSREAGFCLTAITPLPERENATNSITLTSHPMGTDGRVSLFINGSLVESKRFANLARVTDRQTWFNREFGAYVQYTGKEQPTFTSVVVSQDVYRFVFEDDDIDFIFADTTNAKGDVNPTLIVEQYRLAFNIMNNKIEISCEGAIDYAGMITFDNSITGSVDDTAFENTDEMVEALTANGFTVVPLNQWVTREPEEFYPRLALPITNADEIVGSEIEPTELSVVITDRFGRSYYYSGKVSYVMDSCQKHGILLRYLEDQFQIGSEPGTPLTKVKATFTKTILTLPPDDDWQYQYWNNPTAELSADGHTVIGNFGWDDLQEFWCFTRPYFIGDEGNVGDVINYLNIDYTVSGTLSDDERLVKIDTDYTETCAWNTQYPELCRRLNQQDEAEGIMNQRLAGRGGRFLTFNQNPVWSAEAADGRGICLAEDYTPTATRWIPSVYAYGYSIPEPELPM